MADVDDLTHTGNARRLVQMCGHKIRYVVEDRRWLRWTGAHWAPDPGAHHANSCVHELIEAMKREAAEMSADASSPLRKHIRSSQSASAIRSTLEVARTFAGVTHDELNRDPWALNCPNGTLNLRTGELSDHRPDDLHLKVTRAPFDGDATCPKWDRFLETVFAGDQDLIAYLQRMVGYMLTGDVGEQVFWMAHGDGSNGKSTFVEVLQEVFGDFATTLSTESLLSTRNGRGAADHTADLIPLVDARLAVTSEAGPNRALDLALVKRLTGGDTISARRLYGEAFTFRPTHKLIVLTNTRPHIEEHDHAIWRRIQVLPFTVRIPAAEVVPDLGRQLAKERSGILRWAVAGCLEWQQRGLDPPAAIRVASDRYRQDEDPLGRFLSECCELEPSATTASQAIHDAYASWANAEGEEVLTTHALGRALTGRGFEATRAASERRRKGLRLRETAG